MFFSCVKVHSASAGVAIAGSSASGTTYSVIRVPGGVDSAAITGHSVFGVRQMFFARVTISILTSPEWGEYSPFFAKPNTGFERFCVKRDKTETMGPRARTAPARRVSNESHT